MGRAARVFFVLILAGMAKAGDPPQSPAPQTFVKAGKLLDVRSGKPLTNQTIAIRGDRVERVAPYDQVQIPAGAAVTDLSRATVLPGLIDCHTHITRSDTDDSHYDDILLKQSWQYRTILPTLNVKHDLDAGFTAMRDLARGHQAAGKWEIRDEGRSGGQE